MTVTLKNTQLTATLAEHGAELISLRRADDGLEYIWQGDPAFWGRHAPVLFPFVGRLKNDEYRYDGHSYAMGQHGFARDMDFTVIEQTEKEVSFSLKSTPATKKNYPFDFELILSYELTASGLQVRYQVENTGSAPMYFAIGGHPAFNVPLAENTAFSDYYLAYSPQKSRLRLPLVGPYVDEKNKTLAQTNTNIDFSRELFAEDALIYETKGFNAFSIRSDKTPRSVTLSYDAMPYIGVWSPYPKDAPFVCLEPWCGFADTIESSGELVEKPGINRLDAGAVFTTDYTITVS